MIRRLRGFVLELDPVDLMLMASVIEYGVQVRNLLAQRQNHRRQMAAAIAEELPIEAGVDEPSTVPGECAGTTDAGGDHATAGVPAEDLAADDYEHTLERLSGEATPR